MANPIMPKPTWQAFNLADIMILIVAIGSGLAGARSFMEGIPFPFISRYDSFPFQAVLMTAPIASAMTLAWIVVPMRTFRTRLRRIARLPGMTACCGAATALLMIALHGAIRSQTAPYVDGTPWIYYSQFTSASVRWSGIGAVAALVVPMLAAGWRRFRPDPIDWLRLAIGMYWIALFLVVGSI